MKAPFSAWRFVALLVVAAFPGGGTAAAAAAVDAARKLSAEAAAAVTRATYIYKRVGELEIKADVNRLNDTKVRPVIVWIHGGALMMGGRDRIGRHLQQLVNEGAIVVSIDYRLAPETKLPAIIQDLEDAFRWIRARGPELFHADPARIGAWGNSAGGYLTLTAGFRVQPAPQVLVSIYGYGDLIGDWYSQPSPHQRHHTVQISEAQARALVTGVVVANGADRNRQGNIYQADAFYQFCRRAGIWPREVTGWDPRTEQAKFYPFMPIRNVSAQFPPTMLLHGTADTDVPYEQSAMMATELNRHGVPHEFITLRNGEHGFGGADPDLVEAAHQAAIKFTKKHLGLP